MKSYVKRVLGLLVSCLSLVILAGTPTEALQKSETVAIVNGTAITRARVHLHLQSQGLPQDQWAQWEDQALEQLIDRTLIQELLDSRKVSAPSATLDRQLALLEQALKGSETPEETLHKLGMTREQLQRELALPLAWKRYVRQVVTEPQITEKKKKHRAELDGTKRQVAQIFLKIPPDAPEEDVNAALGRLQLYRQQVVNGEQTFAQLAQAHSQAPSAAQGGDMGTFAFTGQMPAVIARQAFATPVEGLSQPFRSSFGVHLLQVTREVPGQLSLEDARREILDHFAEELWNQNVARLRKTARIVRP